MISLGKYCVSLETLSLFLKIVEHLPLWTISKLTSMKGKLCSRCPRFSKFYCGQHGSWHETSVALLPLGAITLFLCKQKVALKQRKIKSTVLVFSKFNCQLMQIWYRKELCFFENFIFIFESSKTPSHMDYFLMR